MMDFRIFLGFSERDFGSCGRQQNVCFQEFACCRAEFVLFSSDPGYLNSEEFDCRGDWEIALSDRNSDAVINGWYFWNANTELLVRTVWAARQLPVSCHDVLDWWCLIHVCGFKTFMWFIISFSLWYLLFLHYDVCCNLLCWIVQR